MAIFVIHLLSLLIVSWPYWFQYSFIFQLTMLIPALHLRDFNFPFSIPYSYSLYDSPHPPRQSSSHVLLQAFLDAYNPHRSLPLSFIAFVIFLAQCVHSCLSFFFIYFCFNKGTNLPAQLYPITKSQMVNPGCTCSIIKFYLTSLIWDFLFPCWLAAWVPACHLVYLHNSQIANLTLTVSLCQTLFLVSLTLL